MCHKMSCHESIRAYLGRLLLTGTSLLNHGMEFSTSNDFESCPQAYAVFRPECDFTAIINDEASTGGFQIETFPSRRLIADGSGWRLDLDQGAEEGDIGNFILVDGGNVAIGIARAITRPFPTSAGPVGADRGL